MRLELVAFPNKLVKTINVMFKGLKDSKMKVEGKLSVEIQKFRRKLEAEVLKAQEAAAKAAAKEPVPVTDAASGKRLILAHPFRIFPITPRRSKGVVSMRGISGLSR